MQPITVVAGARPNFVKVAPLMRVLRDRGIPAELVHTGQHYDPSMSDIFFEELDIPRPDAHLEVGSGSHAKQTAAVMSAFEDYCIDRQPAWTVVVGDVNSTIACALVSAKLGIKVCHVEAGLRSNDWAMPEEINRVITDRLSDLLLTPSADAEENLLREGIPGDRIHLVGNVMIDTLLRLIPRAEKSTTLERLKLDAKRYALVTLHRPSNVDSVTTLTTVISALERVAAECGVVFPLHPRTKKNLIQFNLMERLERNPAFLLTEPLPYLDLLSLNMHSTLVLTDSGGIQEETTVLGVPCLTLRENTERPITVTEGTNQVVGTDFDVIVSAATRILQGHAIPKRCPALWDGHAAERCIDVICSH